MYDALAQSYKVHDRARGREYLHAIIETEWCRLDLFGREQAREQKQASAD